MCAWLRPSAQHHAFEVGEVLTYSIEYKLMGVWVGAGEVTFSVEEENWRGRDCFRFRGYGKTYPQYDWFFKVRDTYLSYADKSDLKPYRFSRDVSEGGFYFKEENLYNYADSQIYTILKVKQQALQLDTIPLKHHSFDVLSLIYETRSIDFSQYRIGDKIPIRMVIDRETYDLFLRYLGTDQLDHDVFGTIDCYLFSPLLVEGTIFKEGEGMKVWVSKDKNRIPVYIESEIRVGTIKSELQKVEGLKYPFKGQ